MFILASDSFLEERKLSLNPLKLVLHSVEYTVYTLHSIHMHFMQTMKGVEIAVLPSLHHYNLFYSCTWPSYLMDLLSLRLVGGVGAIGVIWGVILTGGAQHKKVLSSEPLDLN